MIRLIALGLWICAVTLASGFAAVSWKAGDLPKPDSGGLFGSVVTLKTRMISVPLIVEGAVQGYVVIQLAFAVDSNMLKRLSIKPELIVVDETIRMIYAGEEINFRSMMHQNLSSLANKIAENVNARFGMKLVDNVFIEELNYVPKAEVRKTTVP